MDGRAATEARGPVYAAFRTVALDRPGATAVIGPDGTATTYAMLLRAVDDAAGRLTAGLAPGEVLGLAAEDPLTFVTVYLAAAKLDTVAVLLDGRLPAGERARDTEKFDLDLLAVDAPGPGAFALEPAGARRTGAHGYAPDDFVVHCTSGSTGRPKGIVMSQEAVLARVLLWAGETELVPADVVLCALPLWHCHGIDVLTLPALLTGAAVVFAHGARLTGRGLARCVERHAVTVMSGLPVMYRMLTEARGVPATALGSLRLAVSGSAPLPTHTQESFLIRYGLPLRQVYGLSEIAVICFDRDYTGNGSIGTPVAGVEYRLDPVRTPEAAAGTAYELSVRGPALARGYYRDAEATAEMFEDGWLRTRDLVRVEPDGWYVLGRHSAFVNVAGEKVGPLEVEDALRACPGIRECAVAGVPDPRTTERVAALLVTGPEFDLDATRRRLGERLRSGQLPQRYAFAAALPRTPLGKTDYAAVRELLDTEERDAT
ncbi:MULTISPECIES: class I adenylate-forming enzyme family protein [unclassified Streptomyces]|uniref:class I adenylate-forming enzyme family protein n=1 Tax=unclassified Streptomyces TaxID=2593676 RepID=UPI0035DEFCE9